VLRCVAVCCSVLRYVARCCSIHTHTHTYAHTHRTESIQMFDALCDIFCKSYRLLKLQFCVVFVQQVRQRTQRQFYQHAPVGRLFVAVCCRMLQCVAVRCNVLQRFNFVLYLYCKSNSEYYVNSISTCKLSDSVLQGVAACCSVLQWVAMCCSELQCTSRATVCCRGLQCVAAYCSELQCVAVSCNMQVERQCVAGGCSALQRVAVSCSVLQWVAIRKSSDSVLQGAQVAAWCNVCVTSRATVCVKTVESIPMSICRVVSIVFKNQQKLGQDID